MWPADALKPFAIPWDRWLPLGVPLPLLGMVASAEYSMYISDEGGCRGSAAGTTACLLGIPKQSLSRATCLDSGVDLDTEKETEHIKITPSPSSPPS